MTSGGPYFGVVPGLRKVAQREEHDRVLCDLCTTLVRGTYWRAGTWKLCPSCKTQLHYGNWGTTQKVSDG